MKKNLLFVYYSRFGQTKAIALKMVGYLSFQFNVNLVNIETYSEAEMASFLVQDVDFVVIGCPIYYGHHHKKVIHFIQSNIVALKDIPTAFFSVNLTARKPEKSAVKNNPYLLRFLKETQLDPVLTAVFAGKLQYPRYHFFDRLMIQLIMKITKGVTDKTQEIEYTDWNKVSDFSQLILQHGTGQ